jgi:hypothetical protein
MYPDPAKDMMPNIPLAVELLILLAVVLLPMVLDETINAVVATGAALLCRKIPATLTVPAPETAIPPMVLLEIVYPPWTVVPSPAIIPDKTAAVPLQLNTIDPVED